MLFFCFVLSNFMVYRLFCFDYITVFIIAVVITTCYSGRKLADAMSAALAKILSYTAVRVSFEQSV